MSPLAVSLCLLALGSLALAERLRFLDCGSPDGKISVVDVSPCPSEPCPLRKGQTYLINITFTSDVDTQKSTAYVHGVLAGVPIPFPIPESDGCKSGIDCPILHGKSYNYMTKMPIKSEYPCMKLVVKWELSGDDGKDMFCWEIPVIITN